jgi:sulfonate transport system substrate-binding protein
MQSALPRRFQEKVRMKMTPSIIGASARALAAVLVMGLGVASPASAAGKDPDLSSVTLNVADISLGTRQVLESAGELKDVPYSINWSAFPSGPPAVEALNAGSIDVGFIGNIPPLNAQVAGVPFRIVAAALPLDPKVTQFAIVVPANSPAKSIADLRGKRVTVQYGTTTHIIILKALAAAGLTPEDVTLVNLPGSDARAAFDRGDVDAWVAIEPNVAAVELNGGRVLANAAEWLQPYQFLIANPAALSDAGKNAALADFAARFARAQKWVSGNKDAWAKTYAALTKAPDDVAKIVVDRAQLTFVPLDATVVDEQQSLFEIFHKLGIYKTEISVKDVFDDRYNQVVLAAQK